MQSDLLHQVHLKSAKHTHILGFDLKNSCKFDEVGVSALLLLKSPLYLEFVDTLSSKIIIVWKPNRIQSKERKSCAPRCLVRYERLQAEEVGIMLSFRGLYVSVLKLSIPRLLENLKLYFFWNCWETRELSSVLNRTYTQEILL